MPHVTGQWTQADSSKNCIELAPTDHDGVFALRDTYDQSHTITVTKNQLKNLADAVEKGPMRNLIR